MLSFFKAGAQGRDMNPASFEVKYVYTLTKTRISSEKGKTEDMEKAAKVFNLDTPSVNKLINLDRLSKHPLANNVSHDFRVCSPNFVLHEVNFTGSKYVWIATQSFDTTCCGWNCSVNFTESLNCSADVQHLGRNEFNVSVTAHVSASRIKVKETKHPGDCDQRDFFRISDNWVNVSEPIHQDPDDQRSRVSGTFFITSTALLSISIAITFIVCKKKFRPRFTEVRVAFDLGRFKNGYSYTIEDATTDNFVQRFSEFRNTQTGLVHSVQPSYAFTRADGSVKFGFEALQALDEFGNYSGQGHQGSLQRLNLNRVSYRCYTYIL